LTLALLAFAQLIIAIDFNIVYVALPKIGGELGFSDNSLQWVVSAYTVAFGGFLLLGGRAADRLGAHRVFVLAFVLYGVSSLAGGLAHDQGVLIAARAVQGLGGALATPATLRLINTGFAEGPERNRALAIWGAAGSGGLSAGSVLGGVLTSGLGWSWVFYVNVPLAAIAVVATPWLLPSDHATPKDAHGFDLVGALFATAGITLVVFGLADGPADGWLSAGGAGALIAGLLLVGVFVFTEARARDPLMPLRLYRNRSLVVTIGVMFLNQGALGAVYYVFSTYVQDVKGYSAMEAGLAFLPLTVAAMAASAQLAARLISRWGISVTLAGGLLVSAGGIAALTWALTANGPFWQLLPGLLVFGIGGGVAFVAQFIAATAGVTPDEQGVAAGVANTARMVGQSVVLAAAVAIATAGLHSHGRGSPAAGALGAGLRTAGWITAAITLAAALLALALMQRAVAPNQEPESTGADSALAAPTVGYHDRPIR
jgi:EmrB/QacA subfamily drug resistance transporter